MNEILNRIEQVLDLYGSNKTTLSKKIGIPQSTLSSLYERQGKPKEKITDAILSVYADVRREWLLYGEEPMLRSQMQDLDKDQLLAIISRLSETISSQQATILRLS